MAYTTIDDPSAYFQTSIYTGNSGTQSITNTGNSDLQPDWIWTKARSYNDDHLFVDSVRGVTKYLKSHVTAADQTSSIRVTAFNSDGFSLGSSSDINGNNDTYVAWQWKAGTSFSNDASSTSVGTIDSAGSVNTDAGFSIITYTGTGNAATIAHGLGVKPDWIISKIRSTTGDWNVYHDAFGATGRIKFNSTGAGSNNTSIFAELPTSSVISVGNGGDINTSSGTHIFYCFAGKQGYSKFGSYTGNGNADGSFVYLGFKPAWLMIKRSSAGGDDWMMTDNKMNLFNVINKRLNPNSNGAEQSTDIIDFVSNGFKLRATPDYMNGNGSTYIYMAFAENPFVTSTGVPATAR